MSILCSSGVPGGAFGRSLGSLLETFGQPLAIQGLWEGLGVDFGSIFAALGGIFDELGVDF